MTCAICTAPAGAPHLDGYACRDQLGPVVREAPRTIPPTRICEGCGENLSAGPHGPHCRDVVKVRRLATDPAGRRTEDELERCNVNGQAWLHRRGRAA
jgi:hypothetical protein